MLTVIIVLLVIGLVFLVASRMTPPKAELWIAVFVLYIIELLRILPLGTR